jgi:hypothetical protein
MTSRRTSVATLSVITLAATLALSGCGGDDEPAPGGDGDDRSAGEVLDAAADETLATTRFSVAFTAALEIAGQQLELTADGRVDYDATVADMTLTVDQDGQSQEVGILADGETAWVSTEGDAGVELPDGATYVAGDAASLAEADTFRPEDLLGVVLVLRSGDDAEAGDTEEVGGVETRQYSWTVVYEDAVEAAGEDGETFSKALSLTGNATDSDLDVDVWVGPDDVVRRLEIDIDGKGDPIGGSYDLDLADVGDEVEAPDAPAEDEVATGPEADALFEQLLSS